MEERVSHIIKIIFTLIMFLNINAEAREVKMSLPTSMAEIALSNPGTVNATFDIECYGPTGSIIHSETNVSVTPNSTHKIGFQDTGKCASNVSPTYTGSDNGNNYYGCTGSVTYSNAQSLCGPGQKLCEVGGYSCSAYYFCSGGPYWMKKPTAGFEYNPDTCTTPANYNAAAAGNAPAVNIAYSWSEECRPTGGGNSQSYCQEIAESTSMGAACCEDPAGVAPNICKVTIPNNNHVLASPQWNGGRPF